MKKRSPFSLKTWKSILSGRMPGQVVIQYSDRCNASCVQCGMRASNTFPRTTMKPDDVKRIIDSMAAQGVQAISFTGGEPMLFLDNIAELITYAGKAGIPYIRTGTNGFVFAGHDKPGFRDRVTRLAETLADTPINTFWISMDSADPALHEKNRGFPNIVEGIAKALPIFHEHGLHPSANLGINRYTGGNNTATLDAGQGPDFDPAKFLTLAYQAFDTFYATMTDLGFTIANACYPMSVAPEEVETQAVYTATSTDSFINFSNKEKILLFKALHDVIPKHRPNIRIFTPRSSLLALMDQYRNKMSNIHPCRGGIDFFFIDSKDMNTYPCGYRGGENLGKFWDLDIKKIRNNPFCTKCDWECFRDPSQLATPFLSLFSNPIAMAGKLLKNRSLTKTWLQDLRYYKACNYFNARTPLDTAKLQAFASYNAS